MADLAEFLASFALSQADKDAARKQAMMMAGLGLLGARKGREGEAMAKAGLLGMDTYDQGLAGARQGKVDQYKMAEVWRKQKEAEEAAKAQSADIAAVEQAKQAPWQAAAPWLAATGPVPKDDPLARYQRMAQATKNPANAKIYEELADKQREKFSTTPAVGMTNGQAAYSQFGEWGTRKPADGFVPPPDTEILPLGGKKLAIDKRAVAPGTSFDVTMDPAQQDTSKRGWAQHGLAQQQFAYTKTKDAAEAAARAAGGTGAAGGKDASITESQGTAAVYLTLMGNARKTLDALGGDNAPHPLSVATAKRSGGGYITSGNAQKAAQAQHQWVEAGLRITTGATAPPEEVTRMALMFFPQPGESNDVVAQKKAAREAFEEAVKIKAGNVASARVANVVNAQPGASGGWSITPVK